MFVDSRCYCLVAVFLDLGVRACLCWVLGELVAYSKMTASGIQYLVLLFVMSFEGSLTMGAVRATNVIAGGTWEQVMGVNKKYDCFDCQRNTFSVAKVR